MTLVSLATSVQYMSDKFYTFNITVNKISGWDETNERTKPNTLRKKQKINNRSPVITHQNR